MRRLLGLLFVVAGGMLMWHGTRYTRGQRTYGRGDLNQMREAGL